MDKKSLRVTYGETLVELGAENDKILVLDADLSNATMTTYFRQKYPDRFYNMGIAEANMMCVAAGLAHSGFIPFASTFAIFGAGRAYEQVRNSIVYTKANVKLALTHSGISVGEDGGSHQSIEDIALMRVLPGMTILVPCDAHETKQAVRAAVDIDGPVFIRVARPVMDCITPEDEPFVVGKAKVMREGTDVCLVSTGLMVSETLKAADILEARGVKAAVVNMNTIKPLDEACIARMSSQCKAMLTIEEHSVIGGLGSAVAEVLADNASIPFARLGIQDKFGKSGDPGLLFKEYGLTAQAIVDRYDAIKK